MCSYVGHLILAHSGPSRHVLCYLFIYLKDIIYNIGKSIITLLFYLKNSVRLIIPFPSQPLRKCMTKYNMYLR